jgi:hypothetical protein
MTHLSLGRLTLVQQVMPPSKKLRSVFNGFLQRWNPNGTPALEGAGAGGF